MLKGIPYQRLEDLAFACSSLARDCHAELGDGLVIFLSHEGPGEDAKCQSLQLVQLKQEYCVLLGGPFPISQTYLWWRLAPLCEGCIKLIRKLLVGIHSRQLRMEDVNPGPNAPGLLATFQVENNAFQLGRVMRLWLCMVANNAGDVQCISYRILAVAILSALGESRNILSEDV